MCHLKLSEHKQRHKINDRIYIFLKTCCSEQKHLKNTTFEAKLLSFVNNSKIILFSTRSLSNVFDRNNVGVTVICVGVFLLTLGSL